MITYVYKDGGEGGIIRTVHLMRQLAYHARNDPLLTETAFAVGPSCLRLGQWSREVLCYDEDPEGVETIQTPELMERTIRNDGYVLGDCDDIATYLYTLCLIAGLSPRFVLGAPYPSNELTHVFVECGKYWLDPTVENHQEVLYTRIVHV